MSNDIKERLRVIEHLTAEVLKDTAQDALAHIEQQEQRIAELESQWIPVSERLPEEDDLVVAACKEGVSLFWFELDDPNEMYDFNWWKPLKKPPEQTNE